MVKLELQNIKANTFYKDIRYLLSQGETLMDALMDWSEKNGNDLDFVIELVKRDKDLKEQLEIEGENLRMFRKETISPKLIVK